MPLYRICYLSSAPPARGGIRREFMRLVLSQAKQNNRERGVTGMLVHIDDYFIQVLEGSRGVVSNLMSHIMTDVRHWDVHLVHANPAASRMFPNDMLAFNMDSRDNPLLRRYAVSDGFDPYQLSPHSLDELIDDIILIAKDRDDDSQVPGAGRTLAAGRYLSEQQEQSPPRAGLARNVIDELGHATGGAGQKLMIGRHT